MPVRQSAVARRYAQAVFQLALERGELDQWLRDLRLLSDEVPRGLGAWFADLSLLAQNLAGILVERGRLDLMQTILAEYERLYKAHLSVAEVELRTAIPLEPGEADRLRQRLAFLTGKQVILHTVVDPELMGGVVARVGDKVLDGSLRSKLQALRHRLVGI